MYAVNNAPLLARVYVAPAGRRHMLLERGRVRLAPGPGENRHRPSIDPLFRRCERQYPAWRSKLSSPTAWLRIHDIKSTFNWLSDSARRLRQAAKMPASLVTCSKSLDEIEDMPEEATSTQ